MTDAGTSQGTNASTPSLSWPPPGLEDLQGRVWRGVLITWVGSVILVLPLLWAMAVEQPIWSLGPFGGDWEIATALAVIGVVVALYGFGVVVRVARGAARAADAGFGTHTILEVMMDVTRDTGFLVQGKRHFSLLEAPLRESVLRNRIRGATALLASAIWLALGFSLSVLLATRGFVTPSGVWLLTLGPTAALLLYGFVLVARQHLIVHSAHARWTIQEGRERIRQEGESWIARLDAVADELPMGAGPKGEGRRFRTWATLALIVAVVAVVPPMTLAFTGGVGPVLASIALPEILSVQEMAGAAEALRPYRLEAEEGITPAQAGEALQAIGFVGTSGRADPWERPPVTLYEEPWFTTPDFPDPFAEEVAGVLMARPWSSFTEEERASLRHAATHPAHEAFHLLARAALVDVVAGRWVLPFPDTMSFAGLPWPRFTAFRSAGLAQVARAAVEFQEGRSADAEQTLRELISTGFLLIDQGPTLLDNLMGVVLANMGGDALEALYARTGQDGHVEALQAARAAATAAMRRARAGRLPEDIHSLLQGIPDIVEDEDALRGARWEYFATFNMVAPCMNLHRMVFGPDERYEEWRLQARDALVRVRGERDLFELAEGTFWGRAGEDELRGFFPRFLSLTLGRSGSPGSCANLFAAAQAVR